MRSENFGDGPLCEDFFKAEPEARASTDSKVHAPQSPQRPFTGAEATAAGPHHLGQ